MIHHNFFNTINLSSNELKVENAKAKGLQDTIEVVFNLNPIKEISGWQMKHILEYLLGKKVNINSVRRSITNLKNENVISKTDKMVMGDEGKNEHLYRLQGATENIYKNGTATAADHASKIINSVQGDLFLNS